MHSPRCAQAGKTPLEVARMELDKARQAAKETAHYEISIWLLEEATVGVKNGAGMRPLLHADNNNKAFINDYAHHQRQLVYPTCLLLQADEQKCMSKVGKYACIHSSPHPTEAQPQSHSFASMWSRARLLSRMSVTTTDSPVASHRKYNRLVCHLIVCHSTCS